MEPTEENIKEFTMGMGKANVIAFFLIIPITAIFLLPFLLFWDYEVFEAGRKQLINNIILITVAGVVIHELLHGIGWSLFAPSGFKSIRFGISWKFLTPYCHCKEPLRVKHYKFGGVLPLVILGILPSIIAIVIGNGFLLSFGIFFSWAAGGDIVSLFMLRNLDNNTYVSDHPDKLGFYIVENENPII